MKTKQSIQKDAFIRISQLLFVMLIFSLFVSTSCNQFQNYVDGKFQLKYKILADSNSSADDVTKSAEILKSRLLKYGIPEENIVLKIDGKLINLTIEKADDAARISKLLNSSGEIEFWETYEFKEIYLQIIKADEISNEIARAIKPEEPVKKTTQIDSTQLNMDAKPVDTFPKGLFYFLSPNFVNQEGTYSAGMGALIGTALIKDTAKVMEFLTNPSIAIQFPRDLKFYWGVKPPQYAEGNKFLELFALKFNGRIDGAVMSGKYIVEANADMDQNGNAEIMMQMNNEGARIWKRLTAYNVGKTLAIVIDGYVYTAPKVNTSIEGGKTQISGNFTKEEAEDMANILSLGKLPCKLVIIERTVVGQ